MIVIYRLSAVSSCVAMWRRHMGGLWTLSVEATGKIVGDRQAIGFFFHFVGFILFVKYCLNIETEFFTKVGLYFGNGKRWDCFICMLWGFLINI